MEKWAASLSKQSSSMQFVSCVLTFDTIFLFLASSLLSLLMLSCQTEAFKDLTLQTAQKEINKDTSCVNKR